MAGVKSEKSSLSIRLRENLKAYILIAPAIFLLSVFIIYPIFYLFHSSLFDGSLLSKKRNFIGLENFRFLFSEYADFRLVLTNTIVYSIGLVSVLVLVSTLFALWVNGKIQKRLNSLTLAAAFTPHIISLVSVSMVFLWLMDPQIGAINSVIRFFGFRPFPFLGSSKTALASLMMMMVWKSFGYYSLLILAALQGVPRDIYEAAELDDTPRIKTFFRITLPMISPTLFFIVIVATIGAFQVFETINLMTQGGPVNSTNTLVFLIYSDAFKYLKLGLASAEGVVLFLFVAILTALYFVFLGKKVHYR
ncbi:MAG: sugar ABC transporter permease [Treponema sp.]|jgi:sn-glycerol 3-phosphate transport system permease protein|nr:sugar ABC transporter permease [Treponema sp.]